MLYCKIKVRMLRVLCIVHLSRFMKNKILVLFSLTGLTSSLFFSHWSYFFSLFFFHRHQQLKNHSGSGGVMVVLKFYGFYFLVVVVSMDCLIFFWR